jgi:hypothetical protein
VTIARALAILLSALLTVACHNEDLTGIHGTVTDIHYVIWEQANDKPDTAFIRIDSGQEFRVEVHDRLPLQPGQRVVIQLTAHPHGLKRRIPPACAIIPLNDKGKPLTPLALRPSPHCG